METDTGAATQQHDPGTHRYRLSPVHVADLRDVTRGVDAGEAGLRTSYFVDFEATMGVRDLETRVFDVERFLDNREVHPMVSPSGSSRHARLTRCRRALQSLTFSTDSISHFIILYAVYGEPDPFVLSLPSDVVQRWNDDREHPLAGIARYTGTVEGVRQKMVDAEVLAGAKKTVDESALIVRRSYANRCISSTDAIRHALTEPRYRFPDESSTNYRSRIEHMNTERMRFVTSVRIDASKLLESASIAYHDAWAKH